MILQLDGRVVAGNDLLAGEWGDDILTSGAGADMFIFGSDKGDGHGADRITDFTPDQDHIRINTPRVGFSALTRQGDDTTIDTGGGTIILTGLRPKDLAADDFLFF